MQFTSPPFLVFFACVCLVNFFAAPRFRRVWLLLASAGFIASFNASSLLLILLFSTFNFMAGRQLPKQNTKGLFYVVLLVNGLAIVANNYVVAYGGSIVFLPGSVEFQAGSVLLIIGLSFYSLQHIAYLADVQQKRLAPEQDYLDFLWASCYFPKFISGPVTYHQQLKAQLPLQRPTAAHGWQGVNRMLLGFFKKMVLADRLAPSVSSVFDYNDALPGMTVLAAAILFTIQLYFDFSGYCDIAIGASRLLGVVLPENFDVPLRSTSVTIFWRRWHQSLIAFLTSYVFYPVAFRFRRLKKQAAVLAILATFAVSAIWHGIGLTFALWALCHAVYLIVELYVRKNSVPGPAHVLKKSALAAWVLLLVVFSNVFFRASSIRNACHLFSELVDVSRFFPESWTVQFLAPLAVGGHQLEQFNLLVTLGFVTLTVLFERKIFARASSGRFNAVLTFIVLLLIFMFGVFNSGQRFIYMQF